MSKLHNFLFLPLGILEPLKILNILMKTLFRILTSFSEALDVVGTSKVTRLFHDAFLLNVKFLKADSSLTRLDAHPHLGSYEHFLPPYPP